MVFRCSLRVFGGLASHIVVFEVMVSLYKNVRLVH